MKHWGLLVANPYINHLTLASGHIRRSERAEVDDETLKILAPWLSDAINSGERHPLPVAELAHYEAAAFVEDGGLLVTVFAGENPLVTFGVAQRSRHGGNLWAKMLANFPAKPGTQKPAEPWCAVALHPALIAHPDAMGWMGDFERCVAWAWITRNPQMESVKNDA